MLRQAGNVYQFGWKRHAVENGNTVPLRRNLHPSFLVPYSQIFSQTEEKVRICDIINIAIIDYGHKSHLHGDLEPPSRGFRATVTE